MSHCIDSEHLLGAHNFPLDFIHQNIHTINRDKTYYVHCAGGYRSVIACSILLSKGYPKVINIRGGYKTLRTTALKHSNFVEPKTML